MSYSSVAWRLDSQLGMDAVHIRYLGEPLYHELCWGPECMLWSPEAVSHHKCRKHCTVCYHYLLALDRLVQVSLKKYPQKCE